MQLHERDLLSYVHNYVRMSSYSHHINSYVTMFLISCINILTTIIKVIIIIIMMTIIIII